MIQIEIKPGKFIKLDEEDYSLYQKYKWKLDKKNSVKGYRCCSHRIHTVRLSRLVMRAPDDLCVDHINGDPLDNRKCNLRFCSLEENNYNRKKPTTSSPFASKYKGVTWHPDYKKWQARVAKNGERRLLGYFDNELEAAQAYNKAALELHGEFARINTL